MRVKCVLCDKIEKIDSGSPLAKKLRNRPIHTYMCDTCNERIETRTKERKDTGEFKLFHQDESNDEW
ncbi:MULTISPECIES: YlaI family protein [Bacillales]|uniref:YlaI family protein n=1 Tax=Bacillales TaxID=1385 RepID=UPI001883D55C|nr:MULTISPECIES: YlaI family protein [Bacillaceae]MBF0708297.1 YlaI family protein [Pseudalkalibacillus hwajinpoensis]MDO6657699.1 YlaI family protein [Anaerobacillus sp. 1_MG-2023]WLR59616.1 YlaI family protein [Pseudalkalibacillus hwajinpoensis]